MLPDAVRDELIRARLFDVVVEPRQVELVHAEANQVQKRLNVVDGCRIRVQLVLAQGGEHWVAFEVPDFAVHTSRIWVDDALS